MADSCYAAQELHKSSPIRAGLALRQRHVTGTAALNKFQTREGSQVQVRQNTKVEAGQGLTGTAFLAVLPNEKQ
jgi:hypothetical protein